jgi:hypothetical protein
MTSSETKTLYARKAAEIIDQLTTLAATIRHEAARNQEPTPADCCQLRAFQAALEVAAQEI